MIPDELKADTDSVIWILRLHRDYLIQLEELTFLSDDQKKHISFLEEKQLDLEVNLLFITS